MKRKYTKRNCSYWGHQIRFIHTAIDANTKEIIAYYGTCKRCGKRVLLPTKGNRLDNAAIRHLCDITLESLPGLRLSDYTDYSFLQIYETKNQS